MVQLYENSTRAGLASAASQVDAFLRKSSVAVSFNEQLESASPARKVPIRVRQSSAGRLEARSVTQASDQHAVHVERPTPQSTRNSGQSYDTNCHWQNNLRQLPADVGHITLDELADVYGLE
jgi:hypothetical protein